MFWYSEFYQLSRASAVSEDARDEKKERHNSHASVVLPVMTPTRYKQFRDGDGSRCRLPTPVAEGTPFAQPEALAMFCRLLNDKWPSLLYGEAWNANTNTNRRNPSIQRKAHNHMQALHELEDAVEETTKDKEGTDKKETLRRRCVRSGNDEMEPEDLEGRFHLSFLASIASTQVHFLPLDLATRCRVRDQHLGE